MQHRNRNYQNYKTLMSLNIKQKFKIYFSKGPENYNQEKV